MTGEGASYRERKRQRVVCLECDADLAGASLKAHMQAQHVSSVHTFTVAALNNDGPTECRVSLPTSEKSMECPVEGCRGRATRTPRANLRVRILHTGTPVTLWSCSRRDRSHAPSVTSVKAPQPRDVQAGS